MDVKLKEFNMLMEETDALYHEAAKKLGLSDAQLSILYMIYEKGEGISQYELCIIYGLSKTTINTAVKNLEKDNYILLKPIDGKKMGIYLTESGKVLMHNTAERLIQIENKIYDSWTPEQRELIIQLNRDFMEKFKEAIKEL